MRSTADPEGHLAIGTLVETVDPAGQRTLGSHQTRRLSPQVLKKSEGREQLQAGGSSAELPTEHAGVSRPEGASARRRSGR